MTVHVAGGYSCEFGMNVMRADLAGQGDLSNVYSPAKKRSYAVQCQNLGAGGGGQRSLCQVTGETDTNKMIWATEW